MTKRAFLNPHRECIWGKGALVVPLSEPYEPLEKMLKTRLQSHRRVPRLMTFMLPEEEKRQR